MRNFLAVLVLIAFAPAAWAQATMQPYDTCNKGMPPRPCLCADMPLVEGLFHATRQAEGVYQQILDSHPSDINAAYASYAEAGVSDPSLNAALGECADVGQIVLGLSNWFSPVLNSCYCEKTCDAMAKSTAMHEATHVTDHLRQALEVNYAFVLSAGAASSLLPYGNQLIANAAMSSEVHAQHVQADFLQQTMDDAVAQDCTWEWMGAMPGPPPPSPAPQGFLERLRALVLRVVRGGAS